MCSLFIYGVSVFMCRWRGRHGLLLCTFDSVCALPFHFLLNSLVNAEVCFVKAFKSLSRTIWIQWNPLEAIYYGWPLQGSDLCFALARGFLASDQQHHHDQRQAFPPSGKRSSLQPNGHSMVVTDRLYFTTNSFKRRNRTWFAVCSPFYRFSKRGELARTHWEKTLIFV